MREEKTIAFVIHSLSSGGAERVVTTLSNELVTSYRVVIITLIDLPPFYTLDNRVLVVPCVQKLKPSTSIFSALISNFKLIGRIRFLLLKHRVDICIGFMTTANVLATIAAKLVRIPIIISERNNPYLEDKIIPRLWKILRRISYPHANYVVVQTTIIASYYESFIKSKKLRIIANPINPEFTIQNDIQRLNVVLNVGRLEEQKRQELLIKAFAAINHRNWELHIIGEGEKKVYLNKLIKKLKMQGSVLLLGQRQDIDKYYLQSKIFVLSSEYEGFPNALMEAMHFGLACISTNCPSGPSDLITDSVNGFLIPVNNQEELEKRLSQLIENQEFRITLGKEAQKTTQAFNVNTIAGQWKTIFKALENAQS